MIYFKLFLLIFTFGIERLGATKISSLLSDNSAEVRTEDLLLEFMTDLEELSPKELDFHQLMVLGKKEILHVMKTVLESSKPYFISTEVETTALPRHFGADSVVLFFVDGFTDTEVNSTLAKLSHDHKCKIVMISTKENASYQSIATITSYAVEMKLKYVFYLQMEGQAIKIYGQILNANCQQAITLLDTWRPNKAFEMDGNVLRYHSTLNEGGCPLVVSTFELPPAMILREDENKSVHISGGLEGHLIQTIAEFLDMVPVVKVPYVKETFWIKPDGTVSGIVGDIANGVASIGIGQIRPTSERAELVDLTMSYNHECMVWTVPLRTKYNHSLVTSEFSPTTWIMVILSVLLCCGVAYAIPRLNVGHRLPLNILDVVAITLNYAIPHQPSSVLCKLLFLVYLNYTRVLCTAYSTSLSSILTATTQYPAIVDDEGIIAAGLRTTGTQSSRQILSDQISPDSSKALLIDRYEVTTSLKAALTRIADGQDIAYIRHYSTINYAAKSLTMAGSPLTLRVNTIILRLSEAGIYVHWARLYHASEFKVKIFGSNNDNMLSRLEPIFILYFCCLILAFLAFAAELIVFKTKPN